jgi:hypothetical protein
MFHAEDLATPFLRWEAELRGKGRDCLEPVRRRVNPASGSRRSLAEARRAAYSRAMSFEAIQQEIATWDAGSLRKLQALVVTLRLRQDEPDFAEKMARKIDDRTPGNWVTLEEFGQRLDLPPDAPA